MLSNIYYSSALDLKIVLWLGLGFDVKSWSKDEIIDKNYICSVLNLRQCIFHSRL